MENIVKRNCVQIKGHGEQVILFAHGFGCDQQMWQYIQPHFEQHYKLIYFDYVGSGRSDRLAYDSHKYASLTGYAQDVKDIIQSLQLENIIFVGHSISSMIGLLAAIEMPEKFQKLIMIGPSPCYLNDGEYKGGFNKEDIEELLTMMEMNFTGWASYMAPMVSDDSSPIFAEQLEETFVSGNPRIARQFAEVTFYSDYRQKLQELTVPTLIIQCSDDSIVPIHVGQYLHEHLANSELVIMEAKGHYPHISQSAETAEIITTYIEKLVTSKTAIEDSKELVAYGKTFE